MMYKGNTAPPNFSQNSPKIQEYLGTILLLAITDWNRCRDNRQVGCG